MVTVESLKVMVVVVVAALVVVEGVRVVINAWTDVVSYFVEALSDMVVGALDVGMGIEVLVGVDMNVMAAVMTVFEYSMSIP